MDSTDQGTADRLESPGRAVLVAIGLTIGGMVALFLGELPAAIVDPGLLEGEPSRTGFMASFAFGYVAMAAAGLLYLQYTGRGLSYVDLRLPTLGDWKYTILGIVAAFAITIAVNVAGQSIGVPGSEHQLGEVIGDDSMLVLYLIALVFLFNAPAEEFLFRNVIQKRLYAAFDRMHAVVVTSVIFAAVHFPVYAVTADSLSNTAVTLIGLFGGSIVFGWIFARTENLVVPTLAHAGFNGIQFFLLYLVLEYPEAFEAEMIVAGWAPF